MKRIFWTTTLASTMLGLLLLTGCAAKPLPPQKRAVSNQAQFLESQSSTEVMVKATGEGETIARAMRDSELAALWFVLMGGNNPLLQSEIEKSKFDTFADDFYGNTNRYIVSGSDIKSKRIMGDKTVVERVFVINTGLIREDLVTRNVIASVEALSEGLGAITVTVLPKDATLWSDTQYQAAVDVISEYLQDRNFEVTVLKQAKESNKIIQKAALLSGVVDPMYSLAMESGSDIYISVNLDKTARTVAGTEVKKASVTLSAFYTATAKQVGASSGYSPERAVSGYTSITQEATNDAIEKVLGQIQKSWKKEIEKGKLFKVVVTAAEGLGQSIDRAVYDAMRASCKGVKRNGASNQVFDYTLQCADVADAMGLLDKIERNYAGAGKVFREMDSGALLVLKIANSADDELVIE
ncbi:MAG: hypothetical protein KU37_05190 [Sulfuricurvum sp. PC08-66]|nr:MAG: hypothetical protein KU37_05190 [Sulfuricurvum sp. PC08-66]